MIFFFFIEPKRFLLVILNLLIQGGYTPLHLAVMHCQALIVDILISDYDADINVRDYSGRKPGHYVQSDMPTWVQRALRTNQGTKDGSQIDALVMSTTANLAVMHGKPVSRSWSSIKAENVEEKPDVVVKSRTKSIIRSFRKIKNRDKHPASRENILKAKEIDSKDPARSQSRSLSVPDISLTPRSKKKLLQIEHPHFDDSDLLSNKSCTDVSEAVKSDCSDLDDVFSDEGHNGTKVTYPDQIDSRTDGNRHTSDVKYDLKSKNCKSQQDEKDVVGKSYVMAKVKKDEPDPGRWRANVISNADVMTKATTNCAESMINENVSQWKATTLV